MAGKGVSKDSGDLGEKRKALEHILSEIKKKYGEGAIMKLGEEVSVSKVPVISTGSVSIDRATGIGGIPKGRIVEIYGVESSGKTTLALHIIAEAQKEGGVAAFIDAEHALDTSYASNIGIKVEDLIISQPDYGEQALNIVEDLIRSNAVDVIVVDSVAALVPKVEIEGQIGDSVIGIQARIMSQALRKLATLASQTHTAVIFINQIRMQIQTGFVARSQAETTTGGRALKFYASMIIETRRGESIKKDTETIGHKVRVTVVKNKLAPPYKFAEVPIIYGKGILRSWDIVEEAEKAEILSKSGTWYTYKGKTIAQGVEKVAKYLEENPKLMYEIEYEIRKKYGLAIPKWLLSEIGLLVEEETSSETKQAKEKK